MAEPAKQDVSFRLETCKGEVAAHPKPLPTAGSSARLVGQMDDDRPVLHADLAQDQTVGA